MRQIEQKNISHYKEEEPCCSQYHQYDYNQGDRSFFRNFVFGVRFFQLCISQFDVIMGREKLISYHIKLFSLTVYKILSIFDNSMNFVYFFVGSFQVFSSLLEEFSLHFAVLLFLNISLSFLGPCFCWFSTIVVLSSRLLLSFNRFFLIGFLFSIGRFPCVPLIRWSLFNIFKRFHELFSTILLDPKLLPDHAHLPSSVWVQIVLLQFGQCLNYVSSHRLYLNSLVLHMQTQLDLVFYPHFLVELIIVGLEFLDLTHCIIVQSLEFPFVQHQLQILKEINNLLQALPRTMCICSFSRAFQIFLVRIDANVKLNRSLRTLLQVKQNQMASLYTILAWTFGVYWLIVAGISLKVATSAFKKYAAYRELKNTPPQWDALIRNDYKKWNKSQIILGCILFVPIKFLIMLIFQNTCILIFSISSSQEAIKRKEILSNAWFKLTSPLFFKFIFRVQEDFVKEPITTPIVISNHVSWFDMYYVLLSNGMMSFLAKEEVKNMLFLGTCAKGINSVFIKRKNQEDRQNATLQIAERIKDFNNNKEGAYPLAIFPEGTTSNGKGLLTFKSGAFHNMSPITAFSLKYECENFGMGIDEIGQLQSLVLALAQWPKLKVKKIIVKPEQGQTVEQYTERTKQLLAKAHGLKCTEGGYREGIKLNEARAEDLKKTK